MAKAEGFPLEPAQRCRDGSVAAAIENVLGAGGLWVKTFVLTSALEPAMGVVPRIMQWSEPRMSRRSQDRRKGEGNTEAA